MPSSYFTNFPLRTYTLNSSVAPGEYEWVTDIFRRAATVSNILQDREIFHKYVILEGESPEIIADNEYGSSNYHWVVTLINNILDPLLDWPKNYADLISYINEKYGSVAVASSTIHHYTMTVTKVDSLGHTSSETSIIDATRYAELSSVVPSVYTFSNGVTVTETTTRSTVDSYTYEIDTNEAKRNIRLIKSNYIPQVVAELEKIMSVG